MGCEKVGFIDLSGYEKPVKKEVIKQEKNERNGVSLEQMHGKAEIIIRENKINPEDFFDVYGEEVEADILKAKMQQEKFDSRMDSNLRECKDYADISEAATIMGIKLGWFGNEDNEDNEVMKTAESDDQKSGVDVISEISKKGNDKEYLGLAMDATFSNKISDKFRGIKGEIVRGKLAEIKYFKSGNIKEKKEMPHVVVGMSLGVIKELGKMLVNDDMEGVKKHPVQYQILDEIIIQLDTFEKYALKCGKEDLAKIYHDNSETLKKTKREKEEALPDTGKRDHIFENIKKEMDNFMNDRRR